METTSRHQCLIYEGAPSEQLQSLAIIIQQKLEEGYRCLYLNSPTMVAGLRSQLAAAGTDVAREVAAGRLILSSDTVAPGADFDSRDMLAGLEAQLDQALADGYKGLWATGDMSWEFGHKKNLSKLLEYELGLEDIFRRRPEMCGICQYHRDTLPQEALRQGLLTHPSIFINDTLSRLNNHYMLSRNLEEPASSEKDLDETITEICRTR